MGKDYFEDFEYGGECLLCDALLDDSDAATCFRRTLTPLTFCEKSLVMWIKSPRNITNR